MASTTLLPDTAPFEQEHIAALNRVISVTTPEQRAWLDSASSPVLLYPYWHQAKTAKERLSSADLSLLRSFI